MASMGFNSSNVLPRVRQITAPSADRLAGRLAAQASTPKEAPTAATRRLRQPRLHESVNGEAKESTRESGSITSGVGSDGAVLLATQPQQLSQPAAGITN